MLRSSAAELHPGACADVLHHVRQRAAAHVRRDAVLPQAHHRQDHEADGSDWKSFRFCRTHCVILSGKRTVLNFYRNHKWSFCLVENFA